MDQACTFGGTVLSIEIENSGQMLSGSLYSTDRLIV